MSLKRPRVAPSRSFQANFEEDGEVPLLRVHVVSARGLPRSSGAVGMPDPYVVVKFNGEKVGATKADPKTRRPEWNQNFLIRSDLADPAEPPLPNDQGDESSNIGDDDDDDDDRSACSASEAPASGGGGVISGGWLGGRRALPVACGSCRACRGRRIEVVLEVWDQYIREEEEERERQRSEGRRPSTSKPNDLFDDRLFDVSFVSRCFQRGALRRVQGAVIGGNRLIGVCRISSAQLRALGSSTEPADLAIRDPRGSWWSRSRGTICVAVSLERLQANIIRAELPRNKEPVGVPLGAGVGAGGVARAAHLESNGEEALPPAELSCKVLWNGQDFSSPSRWDKVFCLTQSNNQIWLDVRAPPDLPTSRPESPLPRSPPPRSPAPTAIDSAHPTTPAITEPETPSPTDAVVATLDSPATASPTLSLPPSAAPGGAAAAAAAVATAAAAAAFAVASAGAGAVAAAATAGATAAVATAARAAEAMPPSPVARIAAAVARSARPGRRREGRRRAVCASDWAGDQSCVLTVGRRLHLSTFDAQGLADVLNSWEESTERTVGTREWHDKGFRVHWDNIRRRFTILNVSRRSFVLRGSCSSLAKELLGFGDGDYASEPVPEALLDPQQPSDPPRRHMGVTAESLPPPLLRPHWMRIVWGPPAMEIARGGELRVQVWARQPIGSLPRVRQARRRRRSALSGIGQSDDGSWLVGTALLDTSEVWRAATGNPTKLPLLSPPALWKVERSRSALASAGASTSAAAAAALSSVKRASAATSPVTPKAGLGLGWVSTPASILARQRQRYRRLKRRIAAAGLDKCTPIGVGGARVSWGLPQSRSRRSSSLSASRAGVNGYALTPVGRGKRLAEGAEGVAPEAGAGEGEAQGSGKGGPESGSAAAAAGAGADQASGKSGVVGHVWVSLKLRDPSMLLMKVVRQWNMARDEASVIQRRAAQLEAKRLWMFLPGISLWRVLVQLAGISLLVSYCVTLTLRAYHSTSCRARFNCVEETDPKLASLREWQTLADNLLSAVSFLDMLLQMRTAYVDKNSKIIIEPKKVALHYLRTWFVPDLWCSLPYSTMQPLLQPLLDEVEDAADALAGAQNAAISESLIKAADSPLSLFVYKLSKRLHIGKINSIRGTRAFKYLDDSAMGIDVAVKQVVHVVRGRRKVLTWLGNEPKRRGRIGKFFFRIGVTNKWTRIVLSYRLLGYVKFMGTLVRAMRVLAVAIRAVPRAARVLRLAAVFLRSYEGRRRSKDLHEASIIIQRRAGRHMALKVAGRMQANLRRRTRASSESAITDIAPPSSLSPEPDRSRGISDAAPPRGGGSAAAATRRGRFESSPPPPHPRCRRGLSTPPRSPSLASDVGSGKTRVRTPMSDHRSPSQVPSSGWSDCSWDELHDPRSPPRNWATYGEDNAAVTPCSPPYRMARGRSAVSLRQPAWARDRHRDPSNPGVEAPEGRRCSVAGVGMGVVMAGGGGAAAATGLSSSGARREGWGVSAPGQSCERFSVKELRLPAGVEGLQEARTND